MVKKKLWNYELRLIMGLSGVLAENFPNVKPVERPKVELTGWIYRCFKKKKITSIVILIQT